MYDDADLLADLPPSRDDEPSSLRQDIADELADHLACAFHGELVKSGDAETAKRRVLDRFGDPRQIARKLWFQAMWSRIMWQRVSVGVQVVLLVVVMVASFLMMEMIDDMPTASQLVDLRQQSEQNRQMLATVLERLPQPLEASMGFGPPGGEGFGEAVPEDGAMGMGAGGGMAPGTLSGMPGMGSASGAMGMGGGPMSMLGGPQPAASKAADPNQESLTIEFHVGSEEGPPVTQGAVTVRDETDSAVPIQFLFPAADSEYGGYDMSSNQLALETEAGAAVLCPQMRPGRYTVRLALPDGLIGTARVVVHPGEQKLVTFVAPDHRQVRFVTLTAPTMPSDLKADALLRLSIEPAPQPIGGMTWTVQPQRSWDVAFDPATRMVSEFVLDTGEVLPGYPGNRNKMITTRFWADEPADERFLTLRDGAYALKWGIILPQFGDTIELNSMTRTVSADDTDWTFEFSDDVWQKFRDSLSGAGTPYESAFGSAGGPSGAGEAPSALTPANSSEE